MASALKQHCNVYALYCLRSHAVFRLCVCCRRYNNIFMFLYQVKRHQLELQRVSEPWPVSRARMSLFPFVCITVCRLWLRGCAVNDSSSIALRQCACLPVCLPACLSVLCLSVCLSAYLSVCASCRPGRCRRPDTACQCPCAPSSCLCGCCANRWRSSSTTCSSTSRLAFLIRV